MKGSCINGPKKTMFVDITRLQSSVLDMRHNKHLKRF